MKGTVVSSWVQSCRKLFGDEVERISEFDPLTGVILVSKKTTTIFPATHFITSKEKLGEALGRIRFELDEWNHE